MRDVLPPAKAVVGAPSVCPFCRSTDLKTTSKIIDSSTYWRCGTCGEVWNAARRQEASRYRYGR
ncbi:MAG: hypothetical protein LC804_10080 [Acidobacteria bacterium]|nr:hypothetical protein [Acidobacteriota bacterium]